MNLGELYASSKVSEKERIKFPKNIVLTIPSKEYDIKPWFDILHLTKWEVNVVYPKAELSLMDEVMAIGPKLVIQLGQSFSRRYPFLADGSVPDAGLQARIGLAVADRFVVLHHHDEFSLQDALGTTKMLGDLLKNQRRSFMAVTNHGSIGGWVKQYNECKYSGLKCLFGCLPPGQPIVTLSGVKKIEDVVVGDFVLTHKGRFRRVISSMVRDYEGNIYSPVCWGGSDTWVTGEHPILTYSIDKPIKQNKNFRYLWNYQQQWVRADEISPIHLLNRDYRPEHVDAPVKGRWSDYAVVPRVVDCGDMVVDWLKYLGDKFEEGDCGGVVRKKKTKSYKQTKTYLKSRTIAFDDDLMRFFGLYIAEGSCHYGAVRWSLNTDTDRGAIEFLRKFCLERFGLVLKETKPRQITTKAGICRVTKSLDFYVCNLALQLAMKRICGENCFKKTFPSEWLMMPKDLLGSLIGGIWEGDGNKRSNSLRTTSWSLAHLCSVAVSKVSGRGSRVSILRKDGFIAYDIAWSLNAREVYRCDSDMENCYLPIRKMKSKQYKGKVYNIEVEEDNSYVSGISLHNCEVYIGNYRGDDPEEKKKNRSANHLVLLARTKEGFDNLIKIHNDAQMNGFYYSPRVNHEAIKNWGKGIIALSACAAGELSRLLMAGEETRAEEICKLYMASFDKFYIELQVIEMEEQREVNRRLIAFAKKMGVETVLSVDSHYLDSSHSETHSLLMYIRQKKTVQEVKELDADVWDFDVKNLYYRNAEQVEDIFRNGFVMKSGVRSAPFLDDVFTEEVFYRSMENTRTVAMSIDDIELDSKIKLPKLYPDSAKMLREKVNAGFKKLGLNLKPNKKEYSERVRHEFEVITKLGWADYFLIMDKIISFSKERYGEWSVGYGRGSASGCLISYCLGLTDCDPIVYGLLFERFLDVSRQSVHACTFEE